MSESTALTITADEIALIGGDALRDRAAALKAKECAQRWNLPLDGVTILGGKVYVNNKGLTIMLRRDERGPGSVTVEVVKDAWDDCDLEAVRKRMGSTSKDASARWPDAGLMRAKYKARVAFPDGSSYEAFGDASVITVGLPAVRVPDNMNMMAETRAVNRAIRRATGMDTTAEELPDAPEVELVSGEAIVTGGGAPSLGGASRTPALAAPSAPTHDEAAEKRRLAEVVLDLCARLAITAPERVRDWSALGQQLGLPALSNQNQLTVAWLEQVVARLKQRWNESRVGETGKGAPSDLMAAIPSPDQLADEWYGAPKPAGSPEKAGTHPADTPDDGGDTGRIGHTTTFVRLRDSITPETTRQQLIGLATEAGSLHLAEELDKDEYEELLALIDAHPNSMLQEVSR